MNMVSEWTITTFTGKISVLQSFYFDFVKNFITAASKKGIILRILFLGNVSTSMISSESAKKCENTGT